MVGTANRLCVCIIFMKVDNIMSNEADQIRETETVGESGSSPALANEAASQVNDFSQLRSTTSASDSALARIANVENFHFGVTEQDKTKAIASLGESLSQMVQGDLPHLKKRLQQLGLDTTEIDKRIEAAKAEAAAAKPLQDALLKGDVRALQQLVKDADPAKLAKMVELIQKHFEQTGIGMNLDLVNGQLIVSGGKGADRAIAISKDKLDVIGITNGRYDFNAQFIRENATTEMQGLAERSLSNYLYPPRQWGYKQMMQKSR